LEPSTAVNISAYLHTNQADFYCQGSNFDYNCPGVIPNDKNSKGSTEITFPDSGCSGRVDSTSSAVTYYLCVNLNNHKSPSIGCPAVLSPTQSTCTGTPAHVVSCFGGVSLTYQCINGPPVTTTTTTSKQPGQTTTTNAVITTAATTASPNQLQVQLLESKTYDPSLSYHLNGDLQYFNNAGQKLYCGTMGPNEASSYTFPNFACTGLLEYNSMAGVVSDYKMYLKTTDYNGKITDGYINLEQNCTQGVAYGNISNSQNVYSFAYTCCVKTPTANCSFVTPTTTPSTTTTTTTMGPTVPTTTPSIPKCSSYVCNNANYYYSNEINNQYQNDWKCPTTGTGLYQLKMNKKAKFVKCEEGWMVWQNRFYGDDTSFNCSHSQYAQCFGNPMQAYWFGLEDMAWMSSQGQGFLNMEIELTHCNGQIYKKSYSGVKIGDAPYRLQFTKKSNPLSNCSAMDPGDSFNLPQMQAGTLFNAPFYTYDTASGINPPALYGGGYWQSSGSMLGTNLNAEPVSPQTNKCISGGYNMNWFTLGPLLNCNNPDCPSIYCGTNLVASKMLVRPES